jgi:hypothetical protein
MERSGTTPLFGGDERQSIVTGQIGRSGRNSQVFRGFQVVPERAVDGGRERPVSPGFPGGNDRHDLFLAG